MFLKTCVLRQGDDAEKSLHLHFVWNKSTFLAGAGRPLPLIGDMTHKK